MKRAVERITITIDKELLTWLDSRISKRIFANRSHGLEVLIKKKMQQNEGKDNSYTGQGIA